ncbi:MAG TPA: hypothetical protein VL326_15060, partial [Kofleriaceae bacterium]|nr:hypothetical protein [Kofleriaceae bacterium]
KQIVVMLSSGDKSVSMMEVVGVVVKICTDMKWPDPARSCFAKAQSRDSLRTCEHETLTGTQADKLDDATGGISSVSTQEALKKMGELADKMCACKDAKCAQDVSDEMTKWGQEMSKEMKDPPKMSEADTEKAQAIGMRMGECMTKAMQADVPVTNRGVGGNGNVLDEEPVRPLTEGDKTPDGRVISK